MIFKQLNRLQQIDQLIRQQRTGNAEEFAGKLGVSRRQIYYWLEELREMGLEIEYSRELQSYVYAKTYKIDITFRIHEMKEMDLSDLYAGGIRIRKALSRA